MATSTNILTLDTAPEYRPMHPVWKLLNTINASIGVLGAIIFMIFLPMVAISMMYSHILLGPLTLLVGMGAVVLITTQASWYQTWYPSKKEEIQEDLQSMLRKAKIEEANQEGGEEELKLTYRQTLTQHATTMALFTPFYLAAFVMLFISVNSANYVYGLTESKSIAKLAVTVVLFLSFSMASGGYAISRNVAKNRYSQPKSASERMFRGTAWVAKAVSSIIGMILGGIAIVIGFLLPMYAIGYILIAIEAHPIFLPISMLVVLGVDGFIVMALIGRYTKRLQTRSNAVIKEAVVEEFGEDSEEYQEVVEEIRQQEFGTPEQNMAKYVLPMMLGMMILAAFAVMIVKMLLINADESVQEGVSALVLFIVGFGGIMLGFRVLAKRFENQLMARIGPLAEKIDAATAQCDWETATGLADQLLEVQPDAIGHTSAAITYMMAGQTDKAEYLIRKSLERVLALRNEDSDEVPPTVVFHLHPLALIQLANGQYDAAEKTLRRLLKLDPKSADAFYTLADVELYRHGSGEQAQKFLDKTKKYRGANERPSDKGLLSSQAWIDARLGQYEQAVDKLKTVFAMVNKDNKLELADHYLTRGYIAKEMGKHVTAEAAFNKALALDPDGLIGKLASRAMNA